MFSAPVPETAVDEDHELATCESDVDGSTRRPGDRVLNSETQAERMELPPEGQLPCIVTTSQATHPF